MYSIHFHLVTGVKGGKKRNAVEFLYAFWTNLIAKSMNWILLYFGKNNIIGVKNVGTYHDYSFFTPRPIICLHFFPLSFSAIIHRFFSSISVLYLSNFLQEKLPKTQKIHNYIEESEKKAEKETKYDFNLFTKPQFIIAYRQEGRKISSINYQIICSTCEIDE